MVNMTVEEAGTVSGKTNVTVVAFLLSRNSSALTAGSSFPAIVKDADMKHSSLACITISLQSFSNSGLVLRWITISPLKVNASKSGVTLMS